MKRITLALGGDDPVIILPDVDVEETAKQTFWAAFQNSAQFCVAAKRLAVPACASSSCNLMLAADNRLPERSQLPNFMGA